METRQIEEAASFPGSSTSLAEHCRHHPSYRLIASGDAENTVDNPFACRTIAEPCRSCRAASWIKKGNNMDTIGHSINPDRKRNIDNRPINTKNTMKGDFLSNQPSPREAGFNYGTGWGQEPKPPIYFEAGKLMTVLRAHAHDATALAWSMEMAIRDIRLAETTEEKREAVARLNDAVDKVLLLRSPIHALHSIVAELEQEIERVSPKEEGYVPQQGINYALRPIKAGIAAIRNLLKDASWRTL